VETDLVHESLHCSQFLIGWGFGGIEVNLVFRPEMVLEKPAIFSYLVKTEERFSPRYPGSESTHVLGLLDYLGRYVNGTFIGIYGIRSFPFAGERAVPAGAVASSRNKENQFCTLVAENTTPG
jgi:hypothetical protein